MNLLTGKVKDAPRSPNWHQNPSVKPSEAKEPEPCSSKGLWLIIMLGTNIASVIKSYNLVFFPPSQMGEGIFALSVNTSENRVQRADEQICRFLGDGAANRGCIA